MRGRLCVCICMHTVYNYMIIGVFKVAYLTTWQLIWQLDCINSHLVSYHERTRIKCCSDHLGISCALFPLTVTLQHYNFYFHFHFDFYFTFFLLMVFTRSKYSPATTTTVFIVNSSRKATPVSTATNQPDQSTTVLLPLVQSIQQQIDNLLQRDVERGNSQSAKRS